MPEGDAGTHFVPSKVTVSPVWGVPKTSRAERTGAGVGVAPVASTQPVFPVAEVWTQRWPEVVFKKRSLA